MRTFAVALALAAVFGTGALFAADSRQADVTEKPDTTEKTLAAISSLDARGERIASTYLKDRVAGEPVACLPPGGLRRATSASDNVLLYESGSVVYVNSPEPGCPRVRNNMTRRVSPNSRLCTGDILVVFDPMADVHIGSCTLNEFVPFRRIATED